MKYLAPLLLVLITSTSLAQTIDSGKSKVTFEIENMKIRTVEGLFSGMSGTVDFDPNNPSQASFNVCIKSSTIDTDNTKRDNHLKNEDFFEVDKYPDICFASSSVKKSGDKYEADGKLTMHGVTKNVTIPFAYENKTFTGTLSLERYDYNIGEDTGTFMVGNEVELTIICVVK